LYVVGEANRLIIIKQEGPTNLAKAIVSDHRADTLCSKGSTLFSAHRTGTDGTAAINQLEA
jgi:hypothetical protein